MVDFEENPVDFEIRSSLQDFARLECTEVAVDSWPDLSAMIHQCTVDNLVGFEDFLDSENVRL